MLAGSNTFAAVNTLERIYDSLFLPYSYRLDGASSKAVCASGTSFGIDIDRMGVYSHDSLPSSEE